MNETLNSIEVTFAYNTALGILGRLKRKGVKIDQWIMDFVRFKPMIGKSGEKRKVVFIDGNDFPSHDRTSKNINEKAKELGYSIPHLETAFHLRDILSDREIAGLGYKQIIVMHESWPEGKLGTHYQLGLGRDAEGNWIHACAPVGDTWMENIGFAYFAH